MFESGIHTQHLEWSLQYIKAANSKIITGNPGNKFRPLTLSRSYGIFVLLNGGLVLGCIVFVLEMLWKCVIWFTMRKQKISRRGAKRRVRGKVGVTKKNRK